MNYGCFVAVMNKECAEPMLSSQVFISLVFSRADLIQTILQSDCDWDNKRTECHLYFAGTISALPQWTVFGKMPEYQISKNLYCTLSNIKAPTQLSRVILNNDILEDDTGLEWRQWLVGSNPGILMYCPATTQYVISQFLIWVSDLRRDLNVSWNCQPDMATQSDP